MLTLYVYGLVLVSSVRFCNYPYQCTQQALQDTEIVIRAYKAANGAQTSITGTVSCTAAFSCASTEFIQTKGSSLSCYASHSCYNTSITSNGTSITCSGLQACIFTNISATNAREFLCSGYFSCAHTHIYTTNVVHIEAAGSYSLYNSMIETTDSLYSDNALTITLNGDYAGYGASVLCTAQDKCNIFCNGATSCYMLFIDCTGECHIYNPSENTILPFQNITPPYNSDEHCKTFIYDSFMERDRGANIIINEAVICCRGQGSCSSINRISNTKGNVTCSGVKACASSLIDVSNNGSVFCEASISCYMSQIHKATDIHCMGESSCDSAIIPDSQNILCTALDACMKAEISSSGDLNVYFGGSNAGEAAQIHCNAEDSCHIICAGYNSCLETELVCDGVCSVECDDLSGCPLNWTVVPTQSDVTDFPSYDSSTIAVDTTHSFTDFPSHDTSTMNPSITDTNVTEIRSVYNGSGSSNSSPFWNILTAIIITIAVCCVVVIIIYKRKQDDVSAMISHLIKNKDNDIEKESENKDKDSKAVSKNAEDVSEKQREHKGDSEDESNENEKEFKVEEQEPGTVIVVRDRAETEGGKDESALFNEWLTIKVKLPQYYDVLVANGYDSLAIIKEVTDLNQLQDIGMHKKGHLLKLMKEIQRLKDFAKVNENASTEGAEGE